MRIEPEKVLEQDRVAAYRRIENANVADSLESKKQDRDRDNRGAQNHYETNGVMGPDKQGKAEPGHSRGTHRVDRNDKIEPGQNRRKSVDKYAEAHGHDISIRKSRAVRSVKRPTGIDAALHQGVSR